MDTTPTPTIPVETATGSSGQKMFLLVDSRDDLPIYITMPKNNFVASFILAGFINCKLESAGQLVEPAKPSGPLNHSVLMFTVTDAHKSAALLREILETSCLTASAQLYFFDVVEGFIRSLLPALGKHLTTEDFAKQVSLSGQLTIAAHDYQVEVLRQLTKPKPPGNDAADPGK